MNELLSISASEMARRIKTGDLSPVDLMEVHINRIEEVNPELNAVVNYNFDGARKEAKAAQEKLARGKSRESGLPPFFGVPCTMKDTYAMKGFTWTGGSLFRKDLIADEDATIVKRMKDAGFIIMGRTNVPEAAMWIESYNKIYGRTNNPYDQSRMVGGSSGGEGAIIGAGGSPLGIGSDIGGSIRFPSFFNGVCGHKPSGRLVPQTGHWPEALGKLGPYMSGGPLARRVEDLYPILKIISGPDGKDGITEKHAIKDPKDVDLKGLKVYHFTDIGIAKAGREVKRAITFAAGALEDRGCEVQKWRPEGIAMGLQIWSARMAGGGAPPFKETLFENAGGKRSLLAELGKLIIRRSDVTGPALFFAIGEELARMSDSTIQALSKRGDKLQARIEEKLGDNGVLLSPPFSVPCPKHNAVWRNITAVGFCAIFNVLEFPGTVVPVHWTNEGLPVGVLITSGRMKDHVTLAVAKALEEAFGGWRMPRVL